MTIISDMLEKATTACQQAYAPYSNFPVGVCICTENNQLYSGCNVENAAYPAGQCAETNALGSMIVGGERIIKDVVIVAPTKTFCPPCGGCRQQLSEFSLPSTRIHLYNNEGDHRTYKALELLPVRFETNNLELS